jgi:hypothetical protein
VGELIAEEAWDRDGAGLMGLRCPEDQLTVDLDNCLDNLDAAT